MEKGTESKITKIIGELNKASKTHKGQADRLLQYSLFERS